MIIYEILYYCFWAAVNHDVAQNSVLSPISSKIYVIDFRIVKCKTMFKPFNLRTKLLKILSLIVLPFLQIITSKFVSLYLFQKELMIDADKTDITNFSAPKGSILGFSLGVILDKRFVFGKRIK